MSVRNIFIAGVEKCGTTALADWLYSNELIQDRVPGVKEPYLYVNDEPHPVVVRTSDLPILDASVGYSSNPAAISRLPEQDTQILFCVRNQFERLWSSYKMMKLVGSDDDAVHDYVIDGIGSRDVPVNGRGGAAALNIFYKIAKKHFPRRSHGFVEKYMDKEFAHVAANSFLARIEYELAFFLSRRQFPIVSILVNGFYYNSLRNLLAKYQPSDVSVISVNKLASAEDRRTFVASVFGKNIDTTEIPFMFSSADVDIKEAKPDFHGKEYDLLRSCFSYDLDQARELIQNTRFGEQFLDNVDLSRYMAAR